MNISEDVERMSFHVPGSDPTVSWILLVHVPGLITEISRINSLRVIQIWTATVLTFPFGELLLNFYSLFKQPLNECIHIWNEIIKVDELDTL